MIELFVGIFFILLALALFIGALVDDDNFDQCLMLIASALCFAGAFGILGV